MVRSYNVNRKRFVDTNLNGIWTPTKERAFYLSEVGSTTANKKLPLTVLSQKWLNEAQSVTQNSYNVMWANFEEHQP